MPLLPQGRTMVLGDDLTGTAEAAAALLRPGRTVRLGLDPAAIAGSDDVALDLDLRDAQATDVTAKLASLAPRIADFAPDLVYFKIDSLLRGPVESLVGFALSISQDILVAPALPSQGRTTANGRVCLDAVPAHRTALGRALRLRSRDMDLMVRLDRFMPRCVPCAGLDQLPDGVVVANAENASDLANAWALAMRRGGNGPCVMVGSAGLLRSGAQHMGTTHVAVEPPVLWVTGSRTPVARKQADLLAAETHGWHRDVFIATEDAKDGPDDPNASKALVERAAVLARDFSSVYATGGSTARALVHALGLEKLTVVGELQDGLVVLETGLSNPRHLMIRSGGFGERNALLRLRRSIAARMPDRGAS